jgi:hypothetical protein
VDIGKADVIFAFKMNKYKSYACKDEYAAKTSAKGKEKLTF